MEYFLGAVLAIILLVIGHIIQGLKSRKKNMPNGTLYITDDNDLYVELRKHPNDIKKYKTIVFKVDVISTRK